jgi:F-type H+-transporting ATPase subunit epsilon
VPPLYHLTVLTPDAEVYEGRVQGLVAPGTEGYFGVLARHAAMVAELDTGQLSLVDEHGERVLFAVSGGYLEVGLDRVAVLADTAEAAVAIDVERALGAERRARGRLAARKREVSLTRAETALRRALNRIRVARGATPSQ